MKDIIGFVCLALLLLSRGTLSHSPEPEELLNSLVPEANCGSGLVGGYSAVDLSDEEADRLAKPALCQYASLTNPDNLEGCSVCDADIHVLSACSQVVAGTNYIIVFEATLPCGENANQTSTFIAKVFDPLPGEENAEPQVDEVEMI